MSGRYTHTASPVIIVFRYVNAKAHLKTRRRRWRSLSTDQEFQSGIKSGKHVHVSHHLIKHNAYHCIQNHTGERRGVNKHISSTISTENNAEQYNHSTHRTHECEESGQSSLLRRLGFDASFAITGSAVAVSFVPAESCVAKTTEGDIKPVGVYGGTSEESVGVGSRAMILTRMDVEVCNYLVFPSNK